jgi:uncharacterized protein YcbK (DUF882 family)
MAMRKSKKEKEKELARLKRKMRAWRRYQLEELEPELIDVMKRLIEVEGMRSPRAVVDFILKSWESVDASQRSKSRPELVTWPENAMKIEDLE